MTLCKKTRVVRMAFWVLACLSLSSTSCASSATRQRLEYLNTIEQRSFRAAASATEHPTLSAPIGAVRLDSLLRLAEFQSPRLAAALYRWEEAVKNIGTAVALPEAMLEYEQFVASDPLRVQVMETRQRVMASQMIPNPGKLSARKDMAANDAAVMAAEFEAAKRVLARDLTVAFANVQALDRRIVVADELAGIANANVALVEAMLSTGKADQSELLRMQVERDEMVSDAAALKLRRPALIAVLAQVSGVEIAPDARIAPQTDAVSALPDRAELYAALDTHPMLQMEHARAAVARAKINEAGWMWVPDFVIGAEWMDNRALPGGMPLRNSFGATVGITIPWQFGVNAARSGAAQAEELAAQRMVGQRLLDLRSGLEAMLFERSDAERMIKLLTDSVIPKARQAFELVQTNYSANRATLTDVLNAQQTLFTSLLSLNNARAELLRARAGLYEMTGHAAFAPQGE